MYRKYHLQKVYRSSVLNTNSDIVDANVVFWFSGHIDSSASVLAALLSADGAAHCVATIVHSDGY